MFYWFIVRVVYCMFAENYYTKHLSKKVNFQIGKRKKLKKQKKRLYIFIRKCTAMAVEIWLSLSTRESLL